MSVAITVLGLLVLRARRAYDRGRRLSPARCAPSVSASASRFRSRGAPRLEPSTPAVPRAPRQTATRDVDALRDVSFEVPEGEVFGIIGRNGAGKSTLLKILSRITTPSAGGHHARARREPAGGRHRVSSRPHGARERVSQRHAARDARRAKWSAVFDEIVDFAGVETYIDTPIKRYSSGMQLRLAFAVAAHLAADTIIVDEVLAVGDADFQEKCARTMRASTERGRTSLFVSHNMALVENLCTRAILLDGGTTAGVGQAEAIVRQYLRSAMGDGSACVDYVRDGAAGTRACALRAARMRGADGGPPVQGEDAVLGVEFEVYQPVRQLELWLGLSTVEGERVTALNSSDYRHDWTLEPGAYVADIRLSELRLLPRRYALTLRLQHRAGDVYDDAVMPSCFRCSSAMCSVVGFPSSPTGA